MFNLPRFFKTEIEQGGLSDMKLKIHTDKNVTFQIYLL
jgi:hypothetical protein